MRFCIPLHYTHPSPQRTTRRLLIGALLLFAQLFLIVVAPQGQYYYDDVAFGKETPSPMLPARSEPQSKQWKLTFGDEFNGNTLDTRKWTTCYHWADPDDGCTNEGNEELQWYKPYGVSVHDGVLQLTAFRQQHKGHAYVSGMISSHRHLKFKYGYFEMRAKLSAGQGIWPAFWTLPVNRGWPPEIDVVELLGHKPNTIFMTLHYSHDGEPAQTQSEWTGPNFAEGFHTFGCLWEKDLLVWYVDGKERFRTTHHVPDVPMYLLANLAVGGRWPGSPNEHTRFPAFMEIDYIRLWQ